MSPASSSSRNSVHTGKSDAARSDKPRPHICATCTRGFARLEHLRRHERSHTNEKPYQCAFCGRCFARRDLVLRHQLKLHQLDSSPEHVIVLENNTSANAALPNRLSSSANSDITSPEDAERSHDNPQALPMRKSASSSRPPQRGAPGTTFGDQGSYSSVGSLSRRHNSVSLPLSQPSSLPIYSHELAPLMSNGNLSLSKPLQMNHPSSRVSTSRHDSLTDEASVFNYGSSLPLHMRPNRSQLQSSPAPPPMLSLYPATEEVISNHLSPRSPVHLTPFASREGHIFGPELSTLSREFTAPLPPPLLDIEDPNLKELLGDIDFNTLSMVDWDNIEKLDVDSLLSTADPNNTQGISPGLLLRQHQSLKNLQQYFIGNSADSSRTDSLMHMQQKQKSLKNLQQYFVERYPDHKHKQKGRFPAAPQTNRFHGEGSLGLPTLSRQMTPFTIGDEHDVDPVPPATLPVMLSNMGSSKRIKLCSDTSPTTAEQWLQDIISAPIDHNFPAPSHHVGFLKAPSANVSSTSSSTIKDHSKSYALGTPTEISELFRSRQIDLIRGKSSTNLKVMAPTLETDLIEAVFEPSSLSNGNFNYMSEELRRHIVRQSSLSDDGFPPVQDFNNYMRLYELELNKYFPFIHLPTLKTPSSKTVESIPLLLSMAAIGALFSYHNSNAYLLFNLSKLHIQRFFENEMALIQKPIRKVPLMAHQCLVLHIYISLFINEPDMIEITTRQITSMIGLVNSTKFNEPFDQLMHPPPSCLLRVGSKFNGVGVQLQHVIRQNFEYFTIAQSRIRTIHVFYMLQSFRASLLGLPIAFQLKDLRSGSFCFKESLWQSCTAAEWFDRLPHFTSLWSLVQLSNGESMDSLSSYLSKKGRDTISRQIPHHLPFSNMLPMLMSIHEQVQERINSLAEPMNMVSWRLEHVPFFTDLIKTWEVIFTRMNGSLWIDSSNRNVLTTNDDLKVVLPLYWFLRIKLLINVNPVMSAVMRKDWRAMNYHLRILKDHEENHQGCKQSIPFCLDIFKLWVYNIETIVYDLSDAVLRTPVFFLTCMCAATLLFSVYMELLEDIARGPGDLNYAQIISWIDCHEVVLMLEKSLSPVLKYLENAKEKELIKEESVCDLVQEKERLRSNKSLADARDRLAAITSTIKKTICHKRLSTKSLHLGIRVLADAPVWPVAMGLAEGLRHRASLLSSSSSSSSSPSSPGHIACCTTTPPTSTENNRG